MATRMKVAAAVALMVVLAASVIVSRIVMAPDPLIPVVQEIYRTPQTYDGEIIDKLAALGPDAVPAIGSVLLSGPEFPVVFVRALERIGDARGAKPVIDFILKQAPYSSVDESPVTTAAILALRGMRNTAACKPIASVLRSETAYARVRLASASTCARLCSGDIRAEARSFVLGAYKDRDRYVDPKQGVREDDLYSALVDVDNEESLAILLGVLERGAPSWALKPVIPYLAWKDGSNVADTLQRVVDDAEKYELVVRLSVARAVLDTGRPPTPSLRNGIEKLAAEATPDAYGQETADEAQKLKSRAAEL